MKNLIGLIILILITSIGYSQSNGIFKNIKVREKSMLQHTTIGDTLTVDSVVIGDMYQSKSGLVKVNLNSTVFNDTNIPLVSFTGATNTPISLTGFAYLKSLDNTNFLSVGEQIQVINTNGNVNDGIHVITAIAFNGAATEYQWAGMTPVLGSPFGDFSAGGSGDEWATGSGNNSISNYPDGFRIKSDKDVLINNTGASTTSIISLSTNGSIMVTSIAGFSVFIFDSLFTRFSSIDMMDNLAGDITSLSFFPHFPVSLGSQGSISRQNVFNSSALGGVGIDIKTSNTAYANQLGFNSGTAFETILTNVTPTDNRLLYAPDVNDTLAVRGDLLGSLYTGSGTIPDNTIATLPAVHLIFEKNTTSIAAIQIRNNSSGGITPRSAFELENDVGVFEMVLHGSSHLSRAGDGLLEVSEGDMVFNQLTANKNFVWEFNDQSAMAFHESNGSLGIGLGRIGFDEIVPSARLHINSTGLTSSTWTMQLHDSSGISNSLMVRDDGFVGIGTATPTEKLHVDSGNVLIDGTLINPTGTIADNDATPDVSTRNVWTYNGTANSVVLTDLDNPKVGAFYTIRGNSDTFTTTINTGGNFKIDGGISIVLGADDIVMFYCVADNDYQEISRSFNQ
jgi:hypothetical protein